MILTDPALLIIDTTRESTINRILRLFRGPESTGIEARFDSLPSGNLAEIEDHQPLSNRPAPSLWRNWQTPSHLTATERRARAAALRGLSQARSNDFAGAHESFLDALQSDPRLDLSQLPDFRSLPREGHAAMIAAYEDAGLNVMAARLTASFRHTFRPRLVTRRQRPNAEPSGS